MNRYYLKKIRNNLMCLLSIPFSPKKLNISEQEAYATLQSYFPDVGSSCYVDKPQNKAESGREGVQLSIIIPTYNNEKYVVDAVESVLKQKTTFTWELIVVNDGSTDHTKELLEPYRDLPNVVIVEQENKGLSGARNTGIDLSVGEYITFVDSDDQLLPDAIESLMSAAYSNHANVVAGGYCTTTESGKIHSSVNLPTGWMNPMGNVYGFAWGKVYKREIFDNLRFPEKYWFEDSIFEQIVWPQCKKIYTIQEAVYQYLINVNGISRAGLGQVKALDSVYITVRLLEDKEKFGLTISEDDYHAFLRMVKLSYYRTRWLNEKIRRCVFVTQVALFNKYFKCFHGKAAPKEMKIEKALSNEDYRQYLLCCER